MTSVCLICQYSTVNLCECDAWSSSFCYRLACCMISCNMHAILGELLQKVETAWCREQSQFVIVLQVTDVHCVSCRTLSLVKLSLTRCDPHLSAWTRAA